MLITAAMTSPPLDLLAATTTAPTHTIRAHELKVIVWNMPVPRALINASFLLMLICLSVQSENDLIDRFSPTKANTVLIWEIVCHIASDMQYEEIVI